MMNKEEDSDAPQRQSPVFKEEAITDDHGNTQQRKQRQEKSIVELLKLPKFLHSKVSKCQHKFGCFENTLRGLYRMFWITFAFKTALNNIFLIISPVKLFKSLLKTSNHLDSLKFALFVSLLNSLYKGVLCIMRRFSDNDRLNAAVAGACSALSLFVDSKERRIFFALVIFARSLDTILNMLQKRGLFTKFKYGEVLCWCIMGCFNKYCMAVEPECLNDQFRGFYLKYSGMTRNDTELCGLWAALADGGKI